MTTLPTIVSNQAQKEVVANENFLVTAPPAIFGMKYTTTSALTWGYYGGYWPIDGVLTLIADGTLTLTASTTNYVQVDRSGNVTVNTTGFVAGTFPLYSIVTGASTVTSSIDYRQGYYSLFGYLSLSVAGSSNVTLTQQQAACDHFVFTGALTGSIDVIFPNVKKRFTVYNNTTGAFTLSLQTASGTPITIQQGQRGTFICDGSNNINFISQSSSRLKTVTYAATLTLDWSNADTIFLLLTGNTTITNTNAVPGQRCNLVVKQDGTGSRLITWGSEVRYGTDITGINLTTTANKQDKIGFIFNDDTVGKYDVVAVVRGF